jgi:high-affinity nickel permease
MNQRQGTSKPRPFAFGYFFCLGHSTIVVAIGVRVPRPDDGDWA